MSDGTVARTYARALYEEALSAGRLEDADADVDLIRDALSGSRELVKFFASPVISREKKASILGMLFEKRLSPITFRFMALLVEKKRENILPTIVAAYGELRDEYEGVVEATATVAFTLRPQDEDRIREAIERLTGKRVRLNVKLDPDIIGGMVVRIGDSVFDGSVHHQLENLREQLQGQRATANGAAAR